MMTKIKRLVKPSDAICHIDNKIEDSEIIERREDYENLSDKKMKFKYSQLMFRPVNITWEENNIKKNYDIQINYCTNPFCKNHTQPQMNYKGERKRYKFSGTKEESRRFECIPDFRDKEGIPTIGCIIIAHSNWSLATEIERLIRVNTTVPLEPEYEFHKLGCLNDASYFDEPKSFYKRGKATSNAQKVQCKTCKKYTNILPNKKQSTSYNQKRNDILPMFAKHIVDRVPVSSTCRILGIGRSTYYSKLEWLYRCCLEFLNTHETKNFVNKTFDRMWLSTDMMMYYLNNVRKKGQPKTLKLPSEKKLQTQVVVTAESFSRYVLRADVAYDWDISIDDIIIDTDYYKEDHLPIELRKNAKYTRYSYSPMEPTKHDTQDEASYCQELDEFLNRKNYVNGLHVNPTYTTMAHLLLIKDMVKTRFITITWG